MIHLITTFMLLYVNDIGLNCSAPIYELYKVLYHLLAMAEALILVPI